jgi:hypothetical protein
MKEKMKKLKKNEAKNESSKHFDLSQGTFKNLDKKMESAERDMDNLER